MNERISALIDGELEMDTALHVCGELPHDSAGRDCWANYQLIGDALRSSEYLDRDISARVMASLASEPTVLAPRVPAQTVLSAPLLSLRRPWAIAASLAGVLAVSAMVLPSMGASEQQLAVVAPAAQVPLALRDENLQAYMLAHQAQAPSTTVHSAAHYIKTVSLETENAR